MPGLSDVVIGVDVSHDYVAAPGVKDKRFSPVAMDKGLRFAIREGGRTVGAGAIIAVED